MCYRSMIRIGHELRVLDEYAVRAFTEPPMTRSLQSRVRHCIQHRIAGLFVVAIAAGCGSDPTNPGSGPLATITVTAPAAALDARTSIDLVAALTDAQGNTVSGTVTWSTADPLLASVSAAGRVTGLAETSAVRITATSGSVSGSIDLAVRTADMTSFVETVRSDFGLPAIGGAIVTIGGMAALGVSGERRAGGPDVTEDDQWHIGSNLKAISGWLAGVAVDAGVITWDATVADMFPELTTIRAEYQPVTLRDLATMQSGLPTNPSGVTMTSDDPVEQRNTIAEWAFQQAPVVARGTYSYSNISYAMLGAMLERAWGTSYEAAIQTHLFGPISVTGAGWGPQTVPGASNNPVPHSWNGSAFTPCEGCDNPPWLSAAGRMHIPLRDWSRIIQEMLRGDDGTSSLVSAATGRELLSLPAAPGSGGDYGYGWIVTSRTWANGRVVTHVGSNTINTSVVWVAPERDFAVLALSNAAGGEVLTALDTLVLRLLAYYEDGS